MVDSPNEAFDFINTELPKRLSSNEDPLTLAKGKIPVSLGVGLAMEFVVPEDIALEGKSAYDIWLKKPGNAGKTEDEYLASLRGKDGNNDEILAAKEQAEAAAGRAVSAQTESENILGQVGSIVDAAHQKFSIYIYERTVAVNDKLLRIAPQLNLKSQQPSIDWVGIADTTGPCVLEFKIVNDGVVMSTPVTVNFGTGNNVEAAFQMTQHNLYNGDVLEITCKSGSATNLTLTARYDIGGVI